MNKHFFCNDPHRGSCPSMGTFVSCSDDDNEKLDLRLTVVEGMIREITEQLENIPQAQPSRVLHKVTVSGRWYLAVDRRLRLTFSRGQAAPHCGGRKRAQIVITINDKEYELPLGTGFRSLIYVPEFVDGGSRRFEWTS